MIGDRTKSNSWFLFKKKEDNDCIIIDINENSKNFIITNHNNPVGIILTHEHFDHCFCSDEITGQYNIPLYCSRQSAIAIKNSRKNLSFYSEYQEFKVEKNIITVEDKDEITLNGIKFFFYYTPGHSLGSMCIRTGEYLFTGDTYMNDYKPTTRFPGGNKESLKTSLDLIMHLIAIDKLKILPGHGR